MARKGPRLHVADEDIVVSGDTILVTTAQFMLCTSYCNLVFFNATVGSSQFVDEDLFLLSRPIHSPMCLSFL